MRALIIFSWIGIDSGQFGTLGMSSFEWKSHHSLHSGRRDNVSRNCNWRQRWRRWHLQWLKILSHHRKQKFIVEPGAMAFAEVVSSAMPCHFQENVEVRHCDSAHRTWYFEILWKSLLVVKMLQVEVLRWLWSCVIYPPTMIRNPIDESVQHRSLSVNLAEARILLNRMKLDKV